MSEQTWLRRTDGTVRAPWQVAVFGAAVFASAYLVAAVGFSIAMATPLAAWARMSGASLSQIASLVAIVMATWFTGRQFPTKTGSVWAQIGLARDAWRLAPNLVALAVGVAVIAVPALVVAALGGARFEPATATDSGGATAFRAFALMFPAAWNEELLFRGFAFTVMMGAIGAPRTIGITSAIFGAAHIFNPDPSVASTIAVTCAGAFLAWVRVATGSLVAAFAAHFAINFTQAVVLHAPVSGLALQTPGYRYVATGPAWLTGGEWGPEGGLAFVMAMLAASFLCYRRPRFVAGQPDDSTAIQH